MQYECSNRIGISLGTGGRSDYHRRRGILYDRTGSGIDR